MYIYMCNTLHAYVIYVNTQMLVIQLRHSYNIVLTDACLPFLLFGNGLVYEMPIKPICK